VYAKIEIGLEGQVRFLYAEWHRKILILRPKCRHLRLYASSFQLKPRTIHFLLSAMTQADIRYKQIYGKSSDSISNVFPQTKQRRSNGNRRSAQIQVKYNGYWIQTASRNRQIFWCETEGIMCQNLLDMQIFW
jgi:hypothetical protein